MTEERPKLLDLFCGAGGAARGYQLAGFHVTGVDIKPQPRYAGDVFIRGDALDYCREHGREFDVIHASPPCQGYSATRHLPWLAGNTYPLLIGPTRDVLREVARTWVIENVDRAPLDGCLLCGTMFGKPYYKHRKFESSVVLMSPPHPKHREIIGHGRKISGNNRNGNGFVGLGCTNVTLLRSVVGVDWMTAKEIRQAIPPAYTEFIGNQLTLALRQKGAA